VTGGYFWRENKKTDLEWGRRRATRVEGAAAEIEGYRQFAARRKFSFHCLAGGYGGAGWHGRRGIGKSGGEVAEDRRRQGAEWVTTAYCRTGDGVAWNGRGQRVRRKATSAVVSASQSGATRAQTNTSRGRGSGGGGG
jgi:hypothetical protein